MHITSEPSGMTTHQWCIMYGWDMSANRRYSSWSGARSRVGHERTSDVSSRVSIVHGGCLPSAEAGPSATLAALARWRCSTDHRRPLAVASWSTAQAERCWPVTVVSADCGTTASTAPARWRVSAAVRNDTRSRRSLQWAQRPQRTLVHVAISVGV
jgi:hypothetical protein